MKSPRHQPRRLRRGVGFQILSKQAQEKLIKYEYAVIWLMVLIAITSIVWSITLNILSGDFNNGIIGAKLTFRERDFQKMSTRSKEVFYEDLGQLINETYTDTALEAKSIKTTAIVNENNKTNDEEFKNVLKMTENTTLSETTTTMPKKQKILHSKMNEDSENEETQDAAQIGDDNETIVHRPKVDIVADRKFLASMTVDVDESRWRKSAAVQFVYGFPFITEIVAIIWTAMCLVFQSGVKKYWGLPKPWRIVVPSIFVFSLMTLGTVVYIIITNHYLKLFCTHLRAPLSDPDLISCGQAMSVLRPIIKRHQLRHDTYLNLFRVSYIISFLFWTIALIVTVLRYVFAIDFQLVDVRPGYESPPRKRQSVDVPSSKIRHTALRQSAPKMLHVDERSRHRSEDDFQSAKSQIIEVGTPLLELSPSQTKIG